MEYILPIIFLVVIVIFSAVELANGEPIAYQPDESQRDKK